jgi:hypothetical protein
MKINKPCTCWVFEMTEAFLRWNFGQKKRGEPARVAAFPALKPLRLADARNVVAHIGAKHALPQK